MSYNINTQGNIATGNTGQFAGAYMQNTNVTNIGNQNIDNSVRADNSRVNSGAGAGSVNNYAGGNNSGGMGNR